MLLLVELPHCMITQRTTKRWFLITGLNFQSPPFGDHHEVGGFLQDLLANSKCSLLVAKDPEDRTYLVITIHGDALPLPGSKIHTGVTEPSIDEGGNMGGISAVTQISKLENMLKQKIFTRSEFERLTALLHSRTTESPPDDVDEGDRAKLPDARTQLLRLEASTSGPLNKHVGDRENFHAFNSTPVVHSSF